jgi:hypothetical protein
VHREDESKDEKDDAKQNHTSPDLGWVV